MYTDFIIIYYITYNYILNILNIISATLFENFLIKYWKITKPEAVFLT